MSANSDDESSFDVGGGVDLFIQDTQLDNPSSLGLPLPPQLQPIAPTNHFNNDITDEGSKSGYPYGMECTQVDNGEYSDEDSYMGDGDMYGATQIDDDYLRRLAESDELPAGEQEGVMKDIPEIEDQTSSGQVKTVDVAQIEKTYVDSEYTNERADSAVDVDGKVEPEPAGVHAASEDEEDNANYVDFCVTDTQPPSRLHSKLPSVTRTAVTDRGAEMSMEKNPDSDEDDNNYVDFCITDTQPPTRHSSIHNKQPSVGHVTSTGVATVPKVGTEPATMFSEDQQPEDTHLTVYDYVSLSAPLSHEATNAEANVFSALDNASPPAPIGASGSMSSNAFATAKTGTIYHSNNTGSKNVQVHVEESPTQLDGSLHLSGSSRASHASVSTHSTHSVLLSGEMLGEAEVMLVAEKAPEAPSVQPAAANTVVRADTGGEWLSTKNSKAPILPPMAPTLLRLSPQKAASPAGTTGASEQFSALHSGAKAGESETQLFGPLDDSQALGDVLESRSLDELVRMQEKLRRAINNKTQNVTIHTPREAATSPPAPILEAPLERQQTSYGLSQPSNMAVSSLMMLKTTAGDITGSPNSGGQRRFNTFVADSTLAAVTPAGSNSSRNADSEKSGATSETQTPSPSSSGRKFLKRKFGKPQSHVQALAAVAEDANLQFEMSDEESDVASPNSSDSERNVKDAKRVAKNAHTKVGSAGGKAMAAGSKAGAADSAVGAVKSKVRRIIIEDTQEDAIDDETQRADEEDAEFTADYFVNSPTAATATTATTAAGTSKTSSSNEAQLIAKALPEDFPKSLLQKIPEKFNELWPLLTELGWFWKRGGGIVSYYYIRPKCLVKKGFLMGRDYFGDESEVINFVTTIVKQARATLLKQGINTAPPPPPKAVLVPEPRPASPATTAIPTAKPVSTSNASGKLAHVPAARQLVPQFSTVSVTDGVLPPDDPSMSDIRKIPWKWLWKMLRARDWSWDFGPAHTNYYFAPGYDIRSKSAVLGEHKFDSEESVRRFVRKQNWPEFSKSEQSSGADSQLPDAYLKDPSWQLASHRQKRERESRPSGEDSSDEDNGSDSAQKAVAFKSNIKKAARVAEAGASRSSAANKQSQAKSGKSGTAGQAQKRNFTPEFDEPDQATQAQRMSQVSPIKKAPTNAARTSIPSGAGLIFSERRFVVSGIPEKLKVQLIKDIGKLGGKILSTVPVDGNESRDEVEVDEKSGVAARKGPIYVISHPREFRKPNYLMALATGVTLVHFQWITDCRDANKWLPTESYMLPSGCCALHAYNIFPTRQIPVETPRKSKGGLGPPVDEPLLDGIRVLNLAGSGWDSLVLTAGATTVENEEPLLQALQNLSSRSSSSFKNGRQVRTAVDVILVDPYEYSMSVAVSKASNAYGSSNRYDTPNSLLAIGSSSKAKSVAITGTPKSPAAKLSEAELLVIQHCVGLNSGENDSSYGASSLSAMKMLPAHQRQLQQASAPIVVTTDWLVHCVAMGELLDHSVLDLFTPPPEPQTRPFTYKSDVVTSTGERYSKYDIVYYRSVKQANAARKEVRGSPVNASKSSEVLSLGKITGFVRRDEKSQLFARIRPLVSVQSESALDGNGQGEDFKPRGKVGEKDLVRVRHKELMGDPLNALAMVEVERLSGKAILLHKEDFLRVSKYSFADDSVYFASASWLEENPCVLGDGSSDSNSQEEDSQGMMMRVQRSQDY